MALCRWNEYYQCGCWSYLKVKISCIYVGRFISLYLTKFSWLKSIIDRMPFHCIFLSTDSIITRCIFQISCMSSNLECRRPSLLISCRFCMHTEMKQFQPWIQGILTQLLAGLWLNIFIDIVISLHLIVQPFAGFIIMHQPWKSLLHETMKTFSRYFTMQ